MSIFLSFFCLYVQTNHRTDKQTDRQTDSQRKGKTDKEREKQTNRNIFMHTTVQQMVQTTTHISEHNFSNSIISKFVKKTIIVDHGKEEFRKGMRLKMLSRSCLHLGVGPAWNFDNHVEDV